MRISIREKGVLAIFHPDAADLFNVCSDLKRVCWTLYKPDIRLEKHVSCRDCIVTPNHGVISYRAKVDG